MSLQISGNLEDGWCAGNPPLVRNVRIRPTAQNRGSYTETITTYSRAINGVAALRPKTSPKGGKAALRRFRISLHRLLKKAIGSM